MKKLNLNVIMGIFLLVIGVLLGMEKLNLIPDINSLVMFWSFISLMGVLMMVNDKKVTTIPSIFVFIGIWNVLQEVGVISEESSIFSLFWPLILVIVGANLVFGKSLFSRGPSQQVQTNAGNLVYSGIFSGVEERLSTKDFKGLTATAVFGGVELDLRDIEITDNVQLDLSAVFGGITIILPERYNVTVIAPLALFGGTENKFKGRNDDTKKTIFVNSRAIFGGIELK